MKKIIIVFLLILIFITGCSSNKYYTPDELQEYIKKQEYVTDVSVTGNDKDKYLIIKID